MSFGGGSAQQPVQTQTQSRDPWSGAVPYLNNLYSNADMMRAAGIGYQPYTGQTVAGTNPDLTSGIDWQRQLANMEMTDPNEFAPLQAADSMITNQGMTGQQQSILNRILGVAQNDLSEPVTDYHNLIAGGGVSPDQRAALSRMDEFARDPRAYIQYANVINQANQSNNPYLQQIMDAMNRQIGDRVNSSMSGAGRYGSGAHTDVMARALAESEAPIMSQDYEARQQRAMDAANAIAASNASRAGIYGAIGGQYGEGLARTLQAMQGLSGVAGQRAAMYGATNDALSAGLNRMGQWSQMRPEILQQMMMPAQDLASLGEYQRSLDQQNLDAALKLYNAQQAYPWEELFREAGIVAGGGGLGGTSVTTTSQPSPSTWQRVLGGGLIGGGLGSAFGPIGTGVGAVGGGLLGLL